MAISLIKLNLFKMTFDVLSTFAQKIHNGFVTNIADYATPDPTMVDFQTDIDTFKAALLKWGPEGNRGSHADHIALLSAVTVIKADLGMLSRYAQNAQPANPDSWVNVGFTLKSAPKPPVKLQVVQNFHNFISRSLVAGTIKLKWKRPLDTERSDVKCYLIQFNNIGIQPEIDGSRGIVNGILVTDTSLIIVPPYIGPNYFWVTPFNALGFGVSSDLLLYNAPGKLAP
jgi:hypothetical protein